MIDDEKKLCCWSVLEIDAIVVFGDASKNLVEVNNLLERGPDTNLMPSVNFLVRRNVVRR